MQILCGTWATIYILKKLTLILAEGALNKQLSEERFPKGSYVRQDKIHKVSDHMIKIVFYLGSCVWVFNVMKDSNFLHYSCGGKVERLDLLDNYPCQDFPSGLQEWYLVKIGYYTFEMFFHCTYHRKRQDFSELFLHHFITNTCSILSYSTNMMKTGAAVLLPHDFSDIFIGILKVAYEFLPFWGQMVSFFLLFTSFIYTRLYVFPFVVIK